MSVDLRNPHAWIVDSTELTVFLDLAYSDYHGEIWLYNNDLEVFRGETTFRELYRNRIASTLTKNVDAVKLLIRPDKASAFFGPNPDQKLVEKYRRIAELKDGCERLSTFYFGVAEGKAIPQILKDNPAGQDTWVFYTHGGHLDLNSGIVMLRNTQFPFSGQEHRIVLVWLLQDHPVIQTRLKTAFENCFHRKDNFRWMKVKSVNPFEFELVSGESPETLERRRLRERQNAPAPLSLRGSVDVAILAALPEEMDAMEQVLGSDVKNTPLPGDRYRYTLFQSSKGSRIILLATLNTMGGVPAAAMTWDLLDKWKPCHVILVGVAGGDPREKQQRLGDVVVGEIVVGYELAKLKKNELVVRPRTYEPNQVLRDAAGQVFKRWSKNKKRIAGITRPDGTKKAVQVHSVAIGSGSKLVASLGFFNWLEKIHEKIHATEMEGDGVGYACDQHPAHAHMLVVKGIMDRSDKHSRISKLKDEWKKYAAFAAAQFVRDVLKEL